jgi:beta-glucosidase
MRFPDGFLWGAATASHQVEGGNVNNDWWVREHVPDSSCVEVSGDACDSYHRYGEDIAILAGLGLSSYRFSLEWSRIEPEDGEFSAASRDHYRRMIEVCLRAGVVPNVTINHFTIPRWLDRSGGWRSPVAVDRFARFTEYLRPILERDVPYVCTINEPNIAASFANLDDPAASRASGLPAPDPQVSDALAASHHRAVEIVRSWGGPKVGWAVAARVYQPLAGAEEVTAQYAYPRETRFLEEAKEDDWLGVQAYTRFRVGPEGPVPPPEDAEMTLAGWEYYPESVGEGLRTAAAHAPGIPLLVTENGIATGDDTRRVAYLRGALARVHAAVEAGIDVRGYYVWSLLDNFEWTSGYRPTFGIVAVNRTTFERTVKPSAQILGEIARANELDPE